MMELSLLSFIKLSLLSLFSLIVYFFSKRLYIYIRFQIVQQFKNKNGKKLRRTPLHYGIGFLVEYGDVFHLFDYLLGWCKTLNSDGIFYMVSLWVPMVTISDPALLKQITVSSHAKFPKNRVSYDMLKPLLGSGLVISSGKLWARQRKLLTPLFTEQSIQNMTDKMIDHTIIESEKWFDSQPKEGIDFPSAISHLTLKIIASCAFGIGSDKQSQERLDKLSAAWGEIFIWFSHYTVFAGYMLFGLSYKNVPLPSNLKFNKAIDTMRSQVYEIIQNQREKINNEDTRSEDTNLLDVLLSARDEHDRPLPDELIFDESQTFLFAGHDTTSSLLSWVFYIFCVHTDIQEKVYREVEQFYSQNVTPTMESVKSLKYTQQVIHETLRYYPPVISVDRELTQDMYLGDYYLPKGTDINVNILGLHRNENVWKDANKYDPDRWTEENLAQMKYPLRDAFMPFSRGMRDCIGKNFAITEAAILTSLILKRYKVSFATGVSEQTIGTDLSFMLKPRDFRIQLEERVPSK